MWYLCIRQLVDIIIVVLVCIVTQRNSLNLNGKNDSVLNIESSPPETKDFLNYWFGFETNTGTAFLTSEINCFYYYDHLFGIEVPMEDEFCQLFLATSLPKT